MEGSCLLQVACVWLPTTTAEATDIDNHHTTDCLGDASRLLHAHFLVFFTESTAICEEKLLTVSVNTMFTLTALNSKLTEMHARPPADSKTAF